MSDLSFIARKIQDRLALSDAKEFEVFLQMRSGVSLNVLKGKLETFDLKNSFGFGLRILKEGRLGFSYGTKVEANSEIDKVIQQAIEVSAFAPEATGFVFPGPQALSVNPNLFDAELGKVTKLDKVDLAARLEASAYKTDSRIKNVRYAGYDDEIEATCIINSAGLLAEQMRSLVTLSAYVVAVNQNESQMGGESAQGIGLKGLHPDFVGKVAAERAVARLESRVVPSYKGPILLSPEVSGAILGLLAEALRGDAVAQKKSWLAEDFGKELFSSAVSLVDDPFFPNGAGSTGFDGEGFVSSPRTLINKGRLESFLCDQFWALRLRGSAGQARRTGALSPPHPGYSNLVLEPGKKTFSELMTQLGEGIVIDGVVGLHTADVASGRFSVGVEGFKFIKGQKIAGIRSMAWGGTLRELLGSVVEVGGDLRLYGNVAAPSLWLMNAEISGQ